MPATKTRSRRPGLGRGRGRATAEMTTAGELYAAALAIALDSNAPATERAGASKLMHELADEMRSPVEHFISADGKRRPNRHGLKLTVSELAMRALVCEAIDERVLGDVLAVRA